MEIRYRYLYLKTYIYLIITRKLFKNIQQCFPYINNTFRVTIAE